MNSEPSSGSSSSKVYTKAVCVQGQGQATMRQCGFCAQTPGKDNNHWPLGKLCDSTFMNHEDVIAAIEALKLCPSCLLVQGLQDSVGINFPMGKR